MLFGRVLKRKKALSYNIVGIVFDVEYPYHKTAKLPTFSVDKSVDKLIIEHQAERVSALHPKWLKFNHLHNYL